MRAPRVTPVAFFGQRSRAVTNLKLEGLGFQSHPGEGVYLTISVLSSCSILYTASFNFSAVVMI